MLWLMDPLHTAGVATIGTCSLPDEVGSSFHRKDDRDDFLSPARRGERSLGAPPQITDKERQESEWGMVKSDGLRKVTTIAAGLSLAALVAVVVLLGAKPAEATFPGANGLIAYEADCCFFGPGIQAVDADPSTPSWESITLSDGDDIDPAWSPDGQQIAFARWNPDGSSYEIYVMDADPSTDDAIRLTNNSAAYDVEPAWSPSGRRIAFASDRDGDYEIYVMDTDPSTDDAIQLTNNDAYDAEPAWSPKGRKLAFTRDQDGRLRSSRDREIYVMDRDPLTKDVTRITKNNTLDEYPDWSPSGRKIVFDGYFEGKYGIMVMNRDGSERTAVLRRSGTEPVWSPNGRKIAYTELIYVGDPGYESHIFVMNEDGSGEDRLVSSGDDYSPSWQPIVP
jgi:Tol biopolymer transport system component